GNEPRLPSDLGPELRVRKEPAALGAWLRHDVAPERHLLEEEGRRGEVEAHLEWPAAHLGHDPDTLRLECRRRLEDVHRAAGDERRVEEWRPRDDFPARACELGEEALLLGLV